MFDFATGCRSTTGADRFCRRCVRRQVFFALGVLSGERPDSPRFQQVFSCRIPSWWASYVVGRSTDRLKATARGGSEVIPGKHACQSPSVESYPELRRIHNVVCLKFGNSISRAPPGVCRSAGRSWDLSHPESQKPHDPASSTVFPRPPKNGKNGKSPLFVHHFGRRRVCDSCGPQQCWFWELFGEG